MTPRYLAAAFAAACLLLQGTPFAHSQTPPAGAPAAEVKAKAKPKVTCAKDFQLVKGKCVAKAETAVAPVDATAKPATPDAAKTATKKKQVAAPPQTTAPAANEAAKKQPVKKDAAMKAPAPAPELADVKCAEGYVLRKKKCVEAVAEPTPVEKPATKTPVPKPVVEKGKTAAKATATPEVSQATKTAKPAAEAKKPATKKTMTVTCAKGFTLVQGKCEAQAQ